MITIGCRVGGGQYKLGNEALVALIKRNEITVVEPQLIPDKLTDGFIAAMKENEIQMPSVGIDFPVQLADQQEAIEEILSYIQECQQKMGFTYLFSKVNDCEELSDEEKWQNIEKHVPYVAKRLAEIGIAWGIEPECFSGPFDNFVKVIELAGSDNIFLNFDPTNIHKYGGSYMKALERYSPNRVCSGHIKDGYYRSPEDSGECAIGAGEVNYGDIFQAMNAKDMDVNMYVEHWQSPEILTAAVKYAKQFLPEPAMA